MAHRAEVRAGSGVFNQIADEYDRHRPTYPDALIDRACDLAALTPGAAVLEIGCGTGKLTRSLLARGLRVTAIEPGEQLTARARDQLGGTGEVHFVNARLEETPPARAQYRAVFAASAIHWVNPDVSWQNVADMLVDGGTLALVSYFGLEDPQGGDDQHALRAALAKIAPEVAADWPIYRDLDDTLRGIAQRQDNVSEAWAWLGNYEIARDHAAELFEDAQLTAIPSSVAHTADALNALLKTMSFWARLSPRQGNALIAEIHALQHRLGRPIRSSTVACLVTARRAGLTDARKPGVARKR